jgi:type VI secretion system (T6SS) effector TldE1-like protein
MWIYQQTTGKLTRDNVDVAEGYSGTGEGHNNPLFQDKKNVGPIPQGSYTIGHPFDTQTHGPFVMRLLPVVGGQMFGRDGFLMHGDNTKHDASQGCIIMGRVTRGQVAESGDTSLKVVA